MYGVKLAHLREIFCFGAKLSEDDDNNVRFVTHDTKKYIKLDNFFTLEVVG